VTLVAGSVASFARREDALEIRWPDGDACDVPYLWLRDNCPCNQCRVVQTAEKRFMIGSVPADLAPADVVLDDGRLAVTWPDGHRSSYSLEALQSPRSRGVHRWTPWRAAFQPRRTAWREFLDDDATARSALSDFIEHGAMIIERAPTAPGTLELLVPRLGPIREVLFARIHDVSVDPQGYNIAHTALELPPHNDFASYSWPPSVQALHMLVNESVGGDSVIVDGWRILEELRESEPRYFDALCTMPVPFREFDEGTETWAVAPMIRCDPDGNIAGFRFSNQLMQAVDPFRPGVNDFYRAYHELCRRVTDESGKARFRLDGGDILVVAAHRVLHGREAFDATGRRHLQDAYFELDNIANNLYLLCNEGERDDA
jgi:gamma-butyrobetaine dioxygenase